MSKHTYSNLREANHARQKEWDKNAQITLAYRGNELAGEVGEACNIIKKIERERLGIAGSRATKEQLAEELSDVIICTDLIAMDAGIDLDAAVATKFNTTSEKVGLATRLAYDAHVELIGKLVEALRWIHDNPKQSNAAVWDKASITLSLARSHGHGGE